MYITALVSAVRQSKLNTAAGYYLIENCLQEAVGMKTEFLIDIAKNGFSWAMKSKGLNLCSCSVHVVYVPVM